MSENTLTIEGDVHLHWMGEAMHMVHTHPSTGSVNG